MNYEEFAEKKLDEIVFEVTGEHLPLSQAGKIKFRAWLINEEPQFDLWQQEMENQ